MIIVPESVSYSFADDVRACAWLLASLRPGGSMKAHLCFILVRLHTRRTEMDQLAPLIKV